MIHMVFRIDAFDAEVYSDLHECLIFEYLHYEYIEVIFHEEVEFLLYMYIAIQCNCLLWIEMVWLLHFGY